MNFTDVKIILESLTELVKKSATLDLQEKIVALREYIVSLKDENISLREENQNFKQQLKLENEYTLREGLMWKEGDTVPFCQKCLEGDKKPIHLQRFGSDGRRRCLECNSVYGQAMSRIIDNTFNRRNTGM